MYCLIGNPIKWYDERKVFVKFYENHITTSTLQPYIQQFIIYEFEGMVFLCSGDIKVFPALNLTVVLRPRDVRSIMTLSILGTCYLMLYLMQSTSYKACSFIINTRSFLCKFPKVGKFSQFEIQLGRSHPYNTTPVETRLCESQQTWRASRCQATKLTGDTLSTTPSLTIDQLFVASRVGRCQATELTADAILTYL